MKKKIGVFGSAVVESKEAMSLASQVGEILADHNVIIITGACNGIPYTCAQAAFKKGAQIWGFSPARDLNEQKETTPNHDHSIYTKLFYVPENFSFSSQITVSRKYRNVIATATCDAGIVISGRWGTLNEFTNLIDFGKVIGVLVGSNGIADELQHLHNVIKKKSNAEVIFNNNPIDLIEKIFTKLKEKK